MSLTGDCNQWHVEWTNVYSVDINLMQEKGRGKVGGQEHLVSFVLFCVFFFLLFRLFQLSKHSTS